MEKLVYWAPRILGILSIAFISIFSLDAFAPGVPLPEALPGFAIHLIPSAALLAILIFA